ncbi:hypothetical protein JCM10212_000945 [Sporobolomyces blumeae]
MELEFTPSSALYIKFDVDALNDPSRPPPLSPEILSIASPLPPPPSFDPTSSDPQQKPSLAGKQKNVGMGGDKGKVVPSWLKIGKNAKK